MYLLHDSGQEGVVEKITCKVSEMQEGGRGVGGWYGPDRPGRPTQLQGTRMAEIICKSCKKSMAAARGVRVDLRVCGKEMILWTITVRACLKG
jgi:hypothetical protein